MFEQISVRNNIKIGALLLVGAVAGYVILAVARFFLPVFEDPITADWQSRTVAATIMSVVIFGSVVLPTAWIADKIAYGWR